MSWFEDNRFLPIRFHTHKRLNLLPLGPIFPLCSQLLLVFTLLKRGQARPTLLLAGWVHPPRPPGANKSGWENSIHGFSSRHPLFSSSLFLSLLISIWSKTAPRFKATVRIISRKCAHHTTNATTTLADATELILSWYSRTLLLLLRISLNAKFCVNQV